MLDLLETSDGGGGVVCNRNDFPIKTSRLKRTPMISFDSEAHAVYILQDMHISISQVG